MEDQWCKYIISLDGFCCSWECGALSVHACVSSVPAFEPFGQAGQALSSRNSYRDLRHWVLMFFENGQLSRGRKKKCKSSFIIQMGQAPCLGGLYRWLSFVLWESSCNSHLDTTVHQLRHKSTGNHASLALAITENYHWTNAIVSSITYLIFHKP